MITFKAGSNVQWRDSLYAIPIVQRL